ARGVISRHAHIAAGVELGEGVTVMPFAVLGREPMPTRANARPVSFAHRLRIGDRTVIGPHAVIYWDVELGADCLVGDAASIREGGRIGDRCIIGRQVTVNYECRLGREVRVTDGTHPT